MVTMRGASRQIFRNSARTLTRDGNGLNLFGFTRRCSNAARTTAMTTNYRLQQPTSTTVSLQRGALRGVDAADGTGVLVFGSVVA